MTSEQYQSLLQELARMGGLANPALLLNEGRVKVGDLNVRLEHDVRGDGNLLQVRMLLGGFAAPQRESMTKALLEANYLHGYGGDCVFSVFPESDDVIMTMKMQVNSSMTAQELWQHLSALAQRATRMWDEVVSNAVPA
jgi:hypothetical protein